ncbi:MAG: zinc protease, partial [Congregibacter sp.]
AVREAAQKYIHPERMIVAVLGPMDKIEIAPAIESEPQLSTWGSPARQ